MMLMLCHKCSSAHGVEVTDDNGGYLNIRCCPICGSEKFWLIKPVTASVERLIVVFNTIEKRWYQQGRKRDFMRVIYQLFKELEIREI